MYFIRCSFATVVSLAVGLVLTSRRGSSQSGRQAGAGDARHSYLGKSLVRYRTESETLGVGAGVGRRDLAPIALQNFLQRGGVGARSIDKSPVVNIFSRVAMG